MTENGVQVQTGVQGGIPNAEQFSLLFELSRSFNAFIDLEELLQRMDATVVPCLTSKLLSFC